MRSRNESHNTCSVIYADIYTPYSRLASSWLSSRCIVPGAELGCAGILNLSADKSTNDFDRPPSLRRSAGELTGVKLYAQLIVIKRIRWILTDRTRGCGSEFQFPGEIYAAAPPCPSRSVRERDCNRITLFFL